MNSLSKTEELKLYENRRDKEKYGMSHWDAPLRELRINSAKKYHNVVCPVCPDKPKFSQEKLMKSHIERFHFDQLAHKPQTALGKQKLNQLILDAQSEEAARMRGNDTESNEIIQHLHGLDIEDCDHYLNDCDDDESSDDETVIIEDQDQEDENDLPSTETDQLQLKAKRTNVLDRVMDCTVLVRIMFIIEMLECDISEEKKGSVGNEIMNLVNEVRELYSKVSLPLTEFARLHKFMGNEDDVRQVVSTSYMRKEYRLRDLKDYFIAPKVYDLDFINVKGYPSKLKYSYLSFKSLCEKYIKNPSIRAKLDSEQKDTSPPSCEYEARTRGKLTIEINTDDTQIAPGNGLGTGKGQKYMHMYATFANLPFINRIKSKDIELVLMVKRSSLNEITIGNRFVLLLERAKKDLKDLFTNGVVFEGKRYDVTIGAITGDNLGMYELLGFNYSFKNDSFVCRFCGASGKCKEKEHQKIPTNPESKKRKQPESNPEEQARLQQLCLKCHTIQNEAIKFKLLTKEDFDDPTNKIKYGHIYTYPFEGLPDISIVNVSPPDLMHDLPEGVLPKILERLLVLIRKNIKNNSIKNKLRISCPEIQDIICKKFQTFPFYEGNPKVHWSTNASPKSSFKIDGKAVQKLEAFLKLEAILQEVDFKNGKKMNLQDLLAGTGGYELYLATKKFTLLAFAEKLNTEELNMMRTLANQIVVQCKSLNNSDTYCKLHHLLHYADMVEKFGPLRQFAIFHYEKKHQQSKYIARRMKNFINPVKTISERQQFKRAAVEKRMDFYNYNFYPEAEANYLPNKIDPKNVELKKLYCDDRPFRVNKNVIRKIVGSPGHWFHVEDFHKCSKDGKIYCSGRTLVLKQIQNDVTEVLLELTEKFPRRISEINNTKDAQIDELMCLSSLHYSNDFFHKDNRDQLWLLKWID